jgi:cytochrome c oxidase cbb3-type subunit 3
MSTLFNGQKNNRMSTAVRLLFSGAILLSVVSFMSLSNSEAGKTNQNQASIVGEMNMLPLGGDAELGKALFQAKACFACHGMNGEGNALGPNLTDDFSKQGCKEADIMKVINKGVPGTAMVAYEAQLKPAEVKQLAAFVLSLKGTKPANAKAAEGTKCQ